MVSKANDAASLKERKFGIIDERRFSTDRHIVWSALKLFVPSKAVAGRAVENFVEGEVVN